MPDRTRDAVIRQVQAMGGETFELGVFDSTTERMIPRTWSKETLLKSVPWLRFENLQGRNIYIRPAGIHSLSLVDDLKHDAVKKMKDTGFPPAAVVETSPDNFQVWLQHGRVLEKGLSTAAAKALARRFGGDQGSALALSKIDPTFWLTCSDKLSRPFGTGRALFFPSSFFGFSKAPALH